MLKELLLNSLTVKGLACLEDGNIFLADFFSSVIGEEQEVLLQLRIYSLPLKGDKIRRNSRKGPGLQRTIYQGYEFLFLGSGNAS